METEKVEYKEKVTTDKSYLKEIVAFLNTSGGELVFGINDNGDLVGIEDIDNVGLNLLNTIKDNILPSPIDYLTLNIQKNKTIKITITESICNYKGEKPFYIKNKGLSPVGVYQRKGTATLPMSQEQINQLFKKTHPKQIKDIEAKHQVLTFKKLKNKYKIKNIEFTEAKFYNRGIKLESGKISLLGELFADENSNFIPVAKFQGNSKVDKLISNINFGERPLYESFENAYKKLEAENEIVTTFEGAQRIDRYKYDMEVLREVLINAFVHNDYSNFRYPQIHIFNNRIEIISYGGLPKGQTKEGFKRGVSKPRNKEIVDIFRDFGITESLGIGIPKITSKYGENIFKINDDEITVEIPFDTHKHLMDLKEDFNAEKIEVNVSRKGANAEKEEVNAGKEEVNAEKEEVNAEKEEANAGKVKVNAKKEEVNAEKEDSNLLRKNNLTKKEEDILKYIKVTNELITTKMIEEKFEISNRRSQELLKNLFEKGYLNKSRENGKNIYSLKEEIK